MTKMFISGKIDKLCHILTVEYYTQLGKDETQSHAAMWINVSDSQRQERTY